MDGCRRGVAGNAGVVPHLPVAAADAADEQAGAEEATGDKKILAALAASPLTRGELRKRVAVRNETLGTAVERMIAAGKILRLEDGLAVPVPVPVISRDQRERNGP